VTMEASKRTVFFIMVLHPFSGWIRVGNAYSTKKAAKSWEPFVRSAWRGLRTRVSSVTLEWIDGHLSEASKGKLDKKFNIDPPGAEKIRNDERTAAGAAVLRLVVGGEKK